MMSLGQIWIELFSTKLDWDVTLEKTLLEVPIKADGSEIETGNIFHFKRQD